MTKKIFIDANVILDLFESGRPYHEDSVEVMKRLFSDKETECFIRGDMVSNIFYILQNHYKYGLKRDLMLSKNDDLDAYSQRIARRYQNFDRDL